MGSSAAFGVAFEKYRLLASLVAGIFQNIKGRGYYIYNIYNNIYNIIYNIYNIYRKIFGVIFLGLKTRAF